jgi:hypothetical protein
MRKGNQNDDRLKTERNKKYMRNIDKLKKTLKQQSQTTCDKCGSPMEYHLNGYLVAIDQLPEKEAKRDFDEIQSLMDKHQCSYEELEKVYQSLSLSTSPCERCETLERENTETQFDEWIGLKIDEDPDFLKENTHDEIWKMFVGAEGTLLTSGYFDKTLGALEALQK